MFSRALGSLGSLGSARALGASGSLGSFSSSQGGSSSSSSSSQGSARQGRGKKVGWIGAGVMGGSMARHVAGAGHELYVYAREPGKEGVRSLVEDTGATVMGSPAELASAVDVVCGIVGYPADVESVYLDPESGVLGSQVSDDVLPELVIDLTTSKPSLAVEMAARGAERGVLVLDAPVSGGDVGAKAGQLTVMVGGSEAAFAAAVDVLNPMAKAVTLMGGPGAGQHTKAVNQISIAGGMVAMCEALVYGHAAGLDLQQVLGAISGGAAGSWSLDNYAPRILRRDFAPGFVVNHFVKDLGICLDEAEAMGIALPGLALARQLYIALQAQGHGAAGTQALQLALESLNNIDCSSSGGGGGGGGRGGDGSGGSSK